MRALALVPLLVTFALSSASGQDIHGRMEGFVVGPDGGPVPKVSVTVRGPDLQGNRRTQTNAHGFFTFRWLPVGTYSVGFERLGYEAYEFPGVTVRLGRTTTVGEVRLAVAPIEVEPLIAQAARRLVDPESTAGGVNLTPAHYVNLPNDRDYRSLITLVPAVHDYIGGDVSVAGGTGPETKFFVEGTDVTDPVKGIQATRLPYNFVREVEVKTGGYEAEYRSTLGGIANVVTYSGSNVLRGQVFGFYTNDRLEGAPRFGLSRSSRQSSAQYDVGASIGGPILRDRLWFFAAYNPSVATEEIEIPAHGPYDDRSVRHIFAGKLTWRAAERTNLILTTFGDPGKRDMVQPMSISTSHFTPLNPEVWLGQESFGSVHFVLGGTQVVGEKGLIEAKFSAMNRDDSYMPISETGSAVQVHDYTEQTVSGGTTKYGQTSLGRTNLTLKATWEAGRHVLKAGGGLHASEANTRSDTHHVIKRYGPSTYREVQGASSGTLKSRVYGLFLQDSWQATDRWRVNLGVRWEMQDFLDTDGNVAQTIGDQFAPRLGIIFQPGPIGTQRLFGTAGRFYQDVLLNASGYYDGESWQTWRQCDADPREPGSTCEFLFGSQAEIVPATRGLEGQHYDELTLGYDRQVGQRLKLGARGVYRNLRRAVEDANDADRQEWILGNPGFGPLDEYPAARREYLALELTAEKTVGQGLMFVGSYVLSRTHGNYGGLFDTDYWSVSPNTGLFFDYLELMENADGLLPQDRRHSLKLSASYMTTVGLAAGVRFLWQTGTPLSIRGGSVHPPMFAYLAERGSMGRTPNLWDLDVRLAYDFRKLLRRTSATRLVLDVFNVGGPQTAVAIDQICCFTLTEDGNQSDPNPNYLEPTRFQPPMMVRLGLEVMM